MKHTPDVPEALCSGAAPIFWSFHTINAVMGSFGKSGAWSTYNTPTEGFKRASFQENSGHGKAGSPELNCCSVNAPRALGELCNWAVIVSDDIFYINFYGDCDYDIDGRRISVSGGYPYNDTVIIKSDAGMRLALRVPSFGMSVDEAWANTDYIYIVSSGTDIKLDFNLIPYGKSRTGDFTGMSSIYSGPILFAFDTESNPKSNIMKLKPFDIRMLNGAKRIPKADGEELHLPDGTILCDFYNCGQSGSMYKSWI